MKFLIFFIVVFINLLIASEQKKVCYTAEIERMAFVAKNVQKINQTSYDKSCRRIRLGDFYVVRCGCYDDLQTYKKNLPKFQKKYPNVKKTLTYAYRFQTIPKQPQQPKLKKQKKEDIQKKVVLPKVTSKKQELKKKNLNIQKKDMFCYTIEIKRVGNDYESVAQLSQEFFPPNCVEIPKKHSISISCGCYTSKRAVIEDYRILEEHYEDAHIEKISQKKFQKYKQQKKGEVKKVIKKPLKKITVKKEENLTFIPLQSTVVQTVEKIEDNSTKEDKK
ncbi:hypothetical protein MNB_SM-3-911 [hydrothermal vent metagenome]|uniref:Uncharacterized protein n=1 Tax=hydrothermal vent metagenome TaxID=652676 RepID=A0A1W1D376_9ZZZZ